MRPLSDSITFTTVSQQNPALPERWKPYVWNGHPSMSLAAEDGGRSMAAAHQARKCSTQERIARFGKLLKQGKTERQAEAEMGIKRRTAQRYAAAIRSMQQEAPS